MIRRLARPPLLFAFAAFGLYWVQWLGWPLRAGRDASTYLTYYADFAHDPPLFPVTMTALQPLSPLTFGLLLDHLGTTAVELVLGLMFAASVGIYVHLGSIFGRRVALGIGVALLVYPPYAAIFHEFSSDQLYAFGVAAWALAVAWALRAPSAGRLALAGGILVFPVLTRAAAVPFAVVTLSPLLLHLPWRRRLAYAGIFGASCVAAIALASAYNGIRYGEFTLSRTASAGSLFSVFAHDRLVRPENGPATRRLAEAVRSDLLTRQPYRAYGITLDEFFNAAADRYWADLVSLSDRYWGWESRYAVLRETAFEAVRAHPRPYAESVVRKLANQFTVPFVRAVTRGPAPAGPQRESFVLRGGRWLPAPTEGQPIPASHVDWQLSTPDQSIRMDWSSIEHPQIRFARAWQARLYDDVRHRIRELEAKLGTRNGSGAVADPLNTIARQFPDLWVWLLAGAVGIAFRRPVRAPIALTLIGFALASVLVASLTQPLFLQYRIPLDPIILLFGVVGLFGDQRDGARAA